MLLVNMQPLGQVLIFREDLLASKDSVQEVSNGKRVEESGKEWYTGIS